MLEDSEAVPSNCKLGEIMFDHERFIADCQAALMEDSSYKGVREVVARAVSNPAAVIKGLGYPQQSGVQRLYCSDDLTILNVIWGAHMTIMPHNHEMWAVIGIYTGREDNILWRRSADEANGKITAIGAKALVERDAFPLGRDAIHSVTNPIPRLTGAIHIYGGNFFDIKRSEWDPETLLEQPYDIEKNMRLFEQGNTGTS
uniref:Predicted metal-dependent enzyme of the double-stranded beta helix superfamily n=1 Tax=Candidatus Kentrum sp. FW TaxID=2126338 RepID=A0A450RWB1_9GAMM|nr:MAG: Predicted metal-dependent enzyme of the double-stranded beta helix superfamily [Candidatus Kentron sp. FW]VFJ56396.1 MAG: Predicted metal-dependent enzyme of the double-stranded beta helix superfamily [Candidatus Kentron sp. FW]